MRRDDKCDQRIRTQEIGQSNSHERVVGVSKFSQGRTSVLPYSGVVISAICHSGDRASVQTWPDTDDGGDEPNQTTAGTISCMRRLSLALNVRYRRHRADCESRNITLVICQSSLHQSSVRHPPAQRPQSQFQ